MATFELAVDALLKKEGGAVDDAADHGGQTNFGISARRFPEIDLAQLTRGSAIELYRAHYWHPLYERIDAQAVANKLLELTVHMAHADARPFWQGRLMGVQIVQQACRALGDREISVDGMFGPQTLQAIRLERPEALLAAIQVQQCRHYLTIADRDESQRKFLRGWLRRAVA